ncbi:telomerase RNA component interacting RNase isoform X1 [Polyodon spathula]|uniref:telomerase RNA component interacting RNase isoform X1 n=1 Tax=Polyodon spathula TaxID=7913 RepID=UPI001B7E75E1|nr:telomerase RNA component interacting RNase isoform X1 [Polyodon spathula]
MDRAAACNRGGDNSEPSEPGSSSPAAPPAANAFANDGSFMDLFKKKMEAEKRKRERGEGEEKEEEEAGAGGEGATGKEPPAKSGGRVTSIVRGFAGVVLSSASARLRITVAVFCPLTQVGKRRGGAKLALKTGMVAKKKKLESEVDADKGDAWHMYMAEVQKYKAHQCGDDDKTRPLVK